MSEKIIKLKKSHIKEVKCCDTAGYDGHRYTIVYDNDNGRYIGELQDVTWNDRKFMYMLENLVNVEG